MDDRPHRRTSGRSSFRGGKCSVRHNGGGQAGALRALIPSAMIVTRSPSTTGCELTETRAHGERSSTTLAGVPRPRSAARRKMSRLSLSELNAHIPDDVTSLCCEGANAEGVAHCHNLAPFLRSSVFVRSLRHLR